MILKTCSYCNKDVKGDAKICVYCGKELIDDYLATEMSDTEDVKEKTVPQTKTKEDKAYHVRPWVRFWARHIDYMLFGIVFAIIATIVYPEVLRIPEIGFGLLTIFLWVFVEPFFLSMWGTTPGKWFCRTTIRDSNGQKLTYSSALGRSLNVWIRGLGFGLPLVSMVTEIVAYNNLTAKGATTWDAEGNFNVSHSRIGPLRVMVIIVLYVLYLILLSIPKS